MARDNSYDEFKKHKSSTLKPVRHFFEVVFLKLLLGVAGQFPVSFNQKVGRGIGRLVHKFAKKDRGIADYQLSFAYPELSAEDRGKLVRDCFLNFGQTLMEITSMRKIRKNPEKWIKFENEELIYEALKEGKGAIFLFGHFGNWELMTIVYEMLNIRGKAIGRPVDAEKVNEILRQVRQSTHLEIIERGVKGSGRKMMECFKNNEVFLLGLDQDTEVNSVFVDFFGKPAKTPLGAASFAVKFQVPVLGSFGLRNSDGTHTISIQEITRPPYGETDDVMKELTQSFSYAMENHIRKDPAQWAWFHRRWKNQPDEPEEKEK